MSLASISRESRKKSRVAILHDRALMLQKVRHFFEERAIIEVDVPVLTQTAPIDVHIDLVEARCMGQMAYLQSSPEYGMKRLLAEGIGDIFQMSHVFRDGESGERHNPEFTMAEWYRLGFPFEKMIEETFQFLQLFLDVNSFERLSYADAFKYYAGIDIKEISDTDLLFVEKVEPHLGSQKFTVLSDFPEHMAALSQVVEKNGERVAERFEFYYKGMELANGYHELIEAKEQKRRLERANQERLALKKKAYPIDTSFLKALEKGLEDMCGVACGFDRLMMLRHGKKSIDEVISFSWDQT